MWLISCFMRYTMHPRPARNDGILSSSSRRMEPTVSLCCCSVGAACSMDLIAHKYESFVQKELQKRAASARKEVGICRESSSTPVRDCCCICCCGCTEQGPADQSLPIIMYSCHQHKDTHSACCCFLLCTGRPGQGHHGGGAACAHPHQAGASTRRVLPD
jgi:hypothetical protein